MSDKNYEWVMTVSQKFGYDTVNVCVCVCMGSAAALALPYFRHLTGQMAVML